MSIHFLSRVGKETGDSAIGGFSCGLAFATGLVRYFFVLKGNRFQPSLLLRLKDFKGNGFWTFRLRIC